MPSKVSIAGEAQDLIDELRKVNRENIELRKQQQAVAKESRELNRIATKAFKETATAAEKITKEMEDLGRAFKSGSLDSETYRRAMQKLKTEFRELDDSSSQVFGDVAISQVAAYGSSLLSIGAILGTIKAAYAGVREEQDRLVQALREQLPSSGQLGQIATSAADARQLRRQSDDLFQAGAVRSQEEANRVIFALRSTGQEQDAGLFRELGQAQVVSDLPRVINAFDSLVDAFGKADIQGARELASQSLQISKSTQVGLEDIATAAAQVGAAARQAGFDFEQAGAAVGVISDEQGGVERARTRIGSLFREGQRRGLFSGDLVNDIASIQRRVDAGQSLDSVLGKSSEAQEGFLALSNRLGELGQVIDSVRNSGGLVDNSISSNLQDIGIVSELARRQATARESVTLRDEAIRANIREIEQAQITRLADEAGISAGARAVARGFEGAATFLGLDGVVRDRQLSEIRNTAALSGNQSVVEGVDLAREQVKQLEQLNENASARNNKPSIPVPEAP